jgi:hypothetical protein
VLLNAARTEAFAINMPKVKIGSANTNDGENIIILSFSGVALEYTGSGVGVQTTTIQIQDTTL